MSRRRRKNEGIGGRRESRKEERERRRGKRGDRCVILFYFSSSFSFSFFSSCCSSSLPLICLAFLPQPSFLLTFLFFFLLHFFFFVFFSLPLFYFSIFFILVFINIRLFPQSSPSPSQFSRHIYSVLLFLLPSYSFYLLPFFLLLVFFIATEGSFYLHAKCQNIQPAGRQVLKSFLSISHTRTIKARQILRQQFERSSKMLKKY